MSLQNADTESDQVRHAISNGAVAEALRVAEDRSRAWERRRDEIAAELAAMEATVEEDERRDAELHTKRDRLEAQLKTVIAPREAEALMHEIATIDEQRDALDDDELAALEREAELDDERSAHAAEGVQIAEALAQARRNASDEAASADRRLAELAADAAAARSLLDPALVERYDRLRAQFGVAAAPLVGSRCQACHLDLSPAELDTVRAEAASTGFTDCPNCSRLLVVAD